MVVRSTKTEIGKERWAYVILVIISVLLSVANAAYTNHAVTTDNQSWCEIIKASLPSKAPVMPSDPKHHPDQVKLYNNYQIVYRLGKHLSCL